MGVNDQFIFDIYGAALECPASEFCDHALNALKRIVHFDSAATGNLAITQDQQVVVQSLHLHMVSLERFLDRRNTIGAESLGGDGALHSRDMALAAAFAQRGIASVVDIAEQFASPDILEYCQKYETAHSLCLISVDDFDGMIPVIALWRAARSNPYREQDRHDAMHLIPHMFQAMSINRRLATGGQAGKSEVTFGLANLAGYLFFIEPEAARLLQREWPQWSPPSLPYTVLDALKASNEFVFVGETIEIRGKVQGNMISLRISGLDMGKPALTYAEQRAAKLAVAGLSYKEIARQLELSPATIRNQLHSAYAKLGVSNKTALSAALQGN